MAVRTGSNAACATARAPCEAPGAGRGGCGTIGSPPQSKQATVRPFERSSTGLAGGWRECSCRRGRPWIGIPLGNRCRVAMEAEP